jgi:hypothetical protein
MKKALAAIAAAFILIQPAFDTRAAAEPNSRTEQVHFAKDASATVIKGQLKGDQYVDYQLQAGAGQTLTVTVETTNVQNYFNINPPDSDLSMFVGSSSGNRFSGILPTDGDYTVRVYLMRAAARRDESASYTLSIGVTGKPLAAVPASKDAVIPGTPFHASATITCTPLIDPKVQACEAFVVRRSFDGTATVTVRSPGDIKRRILFVKGEPVASDSPDPLTFTRKGDLTIVTLGADERYEIPDVLVTGG